MSLSGQLLAQLVPNYFKQPGRMAEEKGCDGSRIPGHDPTSALTSLSLLCLLPSHYPSARLGS